MITSKFPFAAIGKAAILGESEGFVKLVSEKKYKQILGVHMIGPYCYRDDHGRNGADRAGSNGRGTVSSDSPSPYRFGGNHGSGACAVQRRGHPYLTDA